MLTQSYAFSLKYEIVQGLVVSGSLLEDVKASVLVCLTSIGKVMLHQPANPNPQFLNIHFDIRALAVLEKPDQASLIVMASENTLTAYDIDNNFNLFYKEMPDGISTLCCGNIKQKSLLLVGGNCVLNGFDEKGAEQYWNVTSDNVCCMQSFGENKELVVVASDDAYVRVYKDEDIVNEISLPMPASSVCGYIAQDNIHIIYSLENGTLGMCERQIEKWKLKDDTDKAEKLLIIDEQYFAVGRFIGKVELRKLNSGALVQKIMVDEVISGLLYDDLRGTQQKQLVIVTKQGNVKGYSVVEKKEESTKELLDEIQQLSEKKTLLQQQIAMYDGKLEQGSVKISIAFTKDMTNKCLNLVLICNDQNQHIIQAILLSDALFPEGQVFTPEQKSYKMHIPLKGLEQNVKAQIRAVCLVSGNIFASSFTVAETYFSIPKFAFFFFTDQNYDIPSYLNAAIKERIPRYAKWLDQCFILDDKTRSNFESYQTQILFNCIDIRNNMKLQINFDSQNGGVQIRCDSMQVCGEIIQDLCEFIQIPELSTSGSFPAEMQMFKEVLDKVQQYQSSKLQLSGDVAETINNVKSLIVRAEDSRLIGDIKTMKKHYSNIMVCNRTIHQDLLKRNANNEILMKSLKEVNLMISKASQLRVGQSKTAVTQLCRQAIKKKNLHSLLEIIQQGKEI